MLLEVKESSARNAIPTLFDEGSVSIKNISLRRLMVRGFSFQNKLLFDLNLLSWPSRSTSIGLNIRLSLASRDFLKIHNVVFILGASYWTTIPAYWKLLALLIQITNQSIEEKSLEFLKTIEGFIE